MFLAKASAEANPQFLSALGRVAVELSRLEYELALIVAYLIDPLDDRIGEILTARMSVNNIAPRLLSLYEHRVNDTTKVEILSNLLKRCKELSDERDRHIHAAWLSYLPLDSAVWQKLTGSGFEQKSELIPIADINKLADNISSAVESVWDVFIQYVEQTR